MLLNASGNVKGIPKPISIDIGTTEFRKLIQDKIPTLFSGILFLEAPNHKYERRRVPGNARDWSDQILKLLNMESIS